MDGYAVIWNDIAHSSHQNPTQLNVIGIVPAGQVSIQTVTSGSAIRIMTGATVPEGADTIIPFEETDEVERRNSGIGLDNININTRLQWRFKPMSDLYFVYTDNYDVYFNEKNRAFVLKFVYWFSP